LRKGRGKTFKIVGFRKEKRGTERKKREEGSTRGNTGGKRDANGGKRKTYSKLVIERGGGEPSNFPKAKKGGLEVEKLLGGGGFNARGNPRKSPAFLLSRKKAPTLGRPKDQEGGVRGYGKRINNDERWVGGQLPGGKEKKNLGTACRTSEKKGKVVVWGHSVSKMYDVERENPPVREQFSLGRQKSGSRSGSKKSKKRQKIRGKENKNVLSKRGEKN